MRSGNDSQITTAVDDSNAARGAKITEQKLLRKLQREERCLKYELDHLNSQVHFICIQARNKAQKDRFELDFRKRQAQLAVEGEAEGHDVAISVYPVSSLAFWSLNGELPQIKPGFPTIEHTGLPALGSWVRKATLVQREAHANYMLHALHGFLNRAQAWSREDWSDNQLPVGREYIEEQVLGSVLATVEKVSSQ